MSGDMDWNCGSILCILLYYVRMCVYYVHVYVYMCVGFAWMGDPSIAIFQLWPFLHQTSGWPLVWFHWHLLASLGQLLSLMWLHLVNGIVITVLQ